jgi:hypothetical protein
MHTPAAAEEKKQKISLQTATETLPQQEKKATEG